MSSLIPTFGGDPIPWVTDLWSGALDGRKPDVERSRAALAALNSIVAGLSDDDRTYSVRFSGDALTTNTHIAAKVVTVGHGPLGDPNLTSGQIAAIMTGLAFHEIGHIRHTRKVEHVLDSYGAKGSTPWKRAQRVLNLADDVRSERLNCVEFPGLAETLPITLRWIGERTIKPGMQASRISTSFGVGIMAVRYPDFVEWTGREAARDWWQAWAERAAVAHTIPALRAVMDEALDHIAEGDDLKDEPTEGGDDATEGEDESEPGDDATEGGDGQGDDADGESDDATEGGEGDSDGEGESDDDATEGGEQGEGSDDADGDGEGDATEGGDSADGEPTEGDDDPWADESDGDATDGEPGGFNPGEAPEQGSGQRDGDEPTDGEDAEGIDAESMVQDCPTDAATDGTEGDVQNGIDAAVTMSRGASGHRSYTTTLTDYRGRTTTYTQEVKRGIPARRGGKATTGGSEGMSFLPPTVGQPMNPTASRTQRPTLRVGVSQALAAAIAASKHGDPLPTPGQRSGRLDRQRLPRVAGGDCRVFTNVVTPGPTRIRAIVLLDASGSMDAGSQVTRDHTGRVSGHFGATRATVAAQVGMDLAGAFDRMRNVTAAIYAHNVNDGVMVHALWQTGEPTDYVGDYADLALDSNADDLAIRYATDDMLMTRRPGEACVIVVVSDGMPPSTALVKAAVEDARKRGIAVVSVAIAPEANEAQTDMYGHEDVVPWEREPMVMARKIAQAIGRRV